MPYKDRSRQLQYQNSWLKARRDEFMTSRSCAWCGSTESLEIHHLNPAEKESHRIWSWSVERIRMELSKCIVICRSCHITYHARQRSRPIVHGIANSYKRGCRCQLCTAAKIEQNRRYTQKKRTLTTE